VVRTGLRLGRGEPRDTVGGGVRGEAAADVTMRFHGYECYLVDPASSHMLVSKIKPCMSKYMP
jgi:hypothetical protein